MDQPPRHVAVIMDGNGRWAAAKRKARTYGHRRGVNVAREITKAAAGQAVSELTLFGFSRENRQRPSGEVEILMRLLSNALSDVDELADNGICLKFVGDPGFFSSKLTDNMRRAEEKTAAGEVMRLNVALNYGGQWDIAQAVSRLPGMSGGDAISDEDACEKLQREISSRLLLGDVDLLIRTGGDTRVSNFLLWQIAYAEIYFTETLWPDFTPDAFKQALRWFAKRQRKFGKTPAQLRHKRLRAL